MNTPVNECIFGCKTQEEHEAHYARQIPTEAVNHPAHYGSADNPYEVIKVAKAWLTTEEMIGALKFQIIKYTPRAGNKPGELASQDIAKATWYANYLKEFLKEKGL